MAFQFGGYDTRNEAGVLATLTAWPSPALTPETVDLLDGAFYARTRRGPVTFTFDLLLTGRTPAAAHALRDRLVGACAPAGELRALIPETGEGWTWWAAVSALSEWTRGVWINGVECQLRGQVSFLVPDGLGWATPDEVAAGTGSATITRTKGNLPSFPTIELAGPFDGVTVTVAGQLVTVAAKVTAGQRLVLDYHALDYGVWAGGAKVAHAAGAMSHLDRLTLPMGASTVTAAATGGAVSSLTIKANSRRG